MSHAYYNEFDPFAAAWLRELIKQGHIAPGVVDERSVEDVEPEYLKQFTQCHFFAGIGVWSYALRQAGWPDDRPVWTGSCPCQPFSSAGKGGGFADERHLWPAFNHLIAECKPAIIFGEQVAAKAVEPWIDLVQADVEGMGYAFGCVAFPSAGVGAPHIRDRAYWVAVADSESRRQPGWLWERRQAERASRTARGHGSFGELGDSDNGGCAGSRLSAQRLERGGQPDSEWYGEALKHGSASTGGRAGVESSCEYSRPLHGFWHPADWLFCRDGRWRPVEPDTFPLAHGAPARVGRLRGYGNAINAEAARAWIETVMERV